MLDSSDHITLNVHSVASEGIKSLELALFMFFIQVYVWSNDNTGLVRATSNGVSPWQQLAISYVWELV